jgi:hypothetical protein
MVRGRQRLLVKPGITCIWHVSGRSDVAFAEQVRMDLDHIPDWDLAMDIKLDRRCGSGCCGSEGAVPDGRTSHTTRWRVLIA